MEISAVPTIHRFRIRFDGPIIGIKHRGTLCAIMVLLAVVYVSGQPASRSLPRTSALTSLAKESLAWATYMDTVDLRDMSLSLEELVERARSADAAIRELTRRHKNLAGSGVSVSDYRAVSEKLSFLRLAASEYRRYYISEDSEQEEVREDSMKTLTHCARCGLVRLLPAGTLPEAERGQTLDACRSSLVEANGNAESCASAEAKKQSDGVSAGHPPVLSMEIRGSATIKKGPSKIYKAPNKESLIVGFALRGDQFPLLVAGNSWLGIAFHDVIAWIESDIADVDFANSRTPNPAANAEAPSRPPKPAAVSKPHSKSNEVAVVGIASPLVKKEDLDLFVEFVIDELSKNKKLPTRNGDALGLTAGCDEDTCLNALASIAGVAFVVTAKVTASNAVMAARVRLLRVEDASILSTAVESVQGDIVRLVGKTPRLLDSLDVGKTSDDNLGAPKVTADDEGRVVARNAISQIYALIGENRITEAYGLYKSRLDSLKKYIEPEAMSALRITVEKTTGANKHREQTALEKKDNVSAPLETEPIVPKPLVEIETSKGIIVVELEPQAAPRTVANFIQYVKSGFYDGTLFHRVIKGFMIQGGGYTPDMKVKLTRPPIVNEADNGLKNDLGTVAMARTSDPNSATAQFFINAKSNAFLNYRDKSQQGWGYCVFGKVVQGLDVVQAIESVANGTSGMFENVPLQPMMITKASLIQATKAAAQAENASALAFISSIPPVADVYMDGRLIGKTNIARLNVLAGTHEMRFVKGAKEMAVFMTFTPGENPAMHVSF